MLRSAIASFASLQQQKNSFLSELQSWRPSQLAFRCAPGSWCALEVLDHVVKTERGIFEELQIHRTQGMRVPLTQKIRSELLIVFMHSPARVRVPHAVSSVITPGNDLDFHTLIASWQDTQVQIEAWLGAFREGTGGRGIFQHPISGWMSGSQAIGFLAAHIRHHRYQLRRIRANFAWQQID